MRVPLLATNIIGSFPLSDTKRNFERAIDDQVEMGLDYVSYPQLAGMNTMFLEPLVDDNTLRREGERFVANQDFEPVVTKDVRRWAEDARERLRKKKEFIPLKSCVTGPFTLVSSLMVEGASNKPFPASYVDIIVENPWLIERLTEYIRKICRSYSTQSSMVSIDEPYLSVLVGKQKNLLELGMGRGAASDLLLETLDRALGGIKTTPSIHACGGISGQLAEILLETDCKILSHEFSVMTRNFDSYGPSEPESHSKILSIGVVTTAPAEGAGDTEPQDLVEKRMEYAIERYGMENVIFSPDCGFRSLAGLLGEEEGYKLSIRKIDRIVRAKMAISKELGLVTIEKDRES